MPVTDFDRKTFEGGGEKRLTVGLEDLDALLGNGEAQLAKGYAVTKIMEQTGLGKSVCYEALKPNGKFTQNLSEHDALLNFKP